MSLPPPRMDERDFDTLVAEALAVVRSRGGSWREPTAGDPGVVLLEAFSHLTEILLHRLDRVPLDARSEFLGLLGVAVAAPSSATTTVVLTHEGEGPAVTVPGGTRLLAPGRGADTVVLLTDTTVEVPVGGTAEVRATHCEQVVAELLGTTDGTPGQTFRLAQPPVVRPTGHELDLVVAVEATDEELAGRPQAVRWDGADHLVHGVVDSFAGATPDQPVVRVDRASGLVQLPPAVRRPAADGTVEATATPLARLPRPGRRVRAWYRHGGGSDGNVAAGAVSVVEGVAGVSVSQPDRATGGADGESLEEALHRGPALMHEPLRAVTAEDVERLATGHGAVARAVAATQTEHWAHGAPGTVEVHLVPALPWATGGADAAALAEGRSDDALADVRDHLAARRPLGIEHRVSWVRAKRVDLDVAVQVAPSEDADAVRERVSARLRESLSPVPAGRNRTGWSFGAPLRTSDVYDIALAEPGVRYAADITMTVPDTPDGSITSLAADHFQPDTWHAGLGSRLYRTQNAGSGWELMHDFETVEVVRVVPSTVTPGQLAIITISPDGTASQLRVSHDCGETVEPSPVTAFSASSPEADDHQRIRDVAWLPADHPDDCLVATDRGLVRQRLDEPTGTAWPVGDGEHGGCWAVAVSPTGASGLEVAVALRGNGGVWLAGPGPTDEFRRVGLEGRDVRRLVVERRGPRRFLWATAHAIGDDPGDGAARAELWGSRGREPEWRWLSEGWDGGICHDLTVVGSHLVLAASQFHGVLRLDLRAPGDGWSGPSVERSGLPLREDRRFEPVFAIASQDDGPALLGTAAGVWATEEGERFRIVSRRTVDDLVSLSSTWLFAPGEMRVAATKDPV